MNVEKANMTIDDIKDLLLKEDIFSLLSEKHYGIFGSLARNEKFNDIDILIEKPNNISALYQFKEKMKKKYKIRFDIMIKEYSDPIILRNAIKDIIYVEQN